MFIRKFTPYLLISSLILADIFIYLGLIKYFLGWDSTIASGVLSFIGAIIGGSLTLIGVKWTLNEGKKEKFVFNFLKLSNNLDEIYDRLNKIRLPENVFISAYTADGYIKDINNLYDDLIKLSIDVYDFPTFKLIKGLKEFHKHYLGKITSIKNALPIDSHGMPIYDSNSQRELKEHELKLVSRIVNTNQKIKDHYFLLERRFQSYID